jgi:hypothetical protein
MSAHGTASAEECAAPTRAAARLPPVCSSGEDSFEIVVTIPAGEDTQETQQLPQNDNHVDDHEEEENNKEEEEGNKAEGEDDKNYTPLSGAEKEEKFHDADEIKTFGYETSIPTSRLRDLLNRISITTPPEFRIKRVPHPAQEEYNAILEIISGPNVLSRHKGPAFRTT